MIRPSKQTMPLHLSTSRLAVRPFTPDDAPALYAILSDPAVMRYIESPFTRAKTDAFLSEHGLCTPPRVYAVIEASGTLVGQLIWHPFDDSSYELGWILARHAWGKGYATELTGALLAQAKAVGISRVVLECLSEQTATVRIAEAFGFLCEEDVNGLLRFAKTLS